MFMLQRRSPAGAGDVLGRQSDDCVVLRHIVTGKYLTWRIDPDRPRSPYVVEDPIQMLGATDNYMEQGCGTYLQAGDTTVGGAALGNGPLEYGTPVWLTSDGWGSGRRFAVVGEGAVTKSLDVQQAASGPVGDITDLVEIRRADGWLSRAVLRASRRAGGLGGVAERLRSLDGFSLPLKKDGSVDEAEKDGYMLRHPSRSAILSLGARASTYISAMVSLLGEGDGDR
jgi:hypothetical protein